MEILLSVIFSIAGVFDVQSTDPILAAFKRARRALIVCLVAQLACVVLAFAFAPEGANSPGGTAQLSEHVSHLVGRGFAIVALACSLGIVWFSVRCLHIHFRPEHYVE